MKEQRLTVLRPPAPDETALGYYEKAMTILSSMAEMVRQTNERMAALESQVRQLEKLTPGQGAELNRLIRERAAEICRDWRMAGAEKEVAGAIRRAVRTYTGARSAREVPRCEWEAVCRMAEGWEDYQVIQRIRKGARDGKKA